MARVYLLDVQTVSKKGYIFGNVEEDTIKETIFRCQESEIQPILGSPLFRKMKEKIEEWYAAGGTGSGVYYELWITYIVPALIPMVERKITFHLSDKIQNKTTGSNSDEYMKTGSNSELNNLRAELDRDKTYFRNQLVKHLKADNGSNYPEYKEHINSCEDFKPDGEDEPFYSESFDIW
jgi:hypothetical protein